jgi:cell wall-associated NlpC family hydrolase
MSDWRKAVLKRLGAKATPQNLKFLDTWQRWEGGHTHNDARFNWLNTTQGKGSAINSVGVKRFGSFNEGVANTVATLQNGRYADIIDALRSGDPYTARPTAGLSTWVSGSPTARPDYAAKILGGSADGGRAAGEARGNAPAPKLPGPDPGTDWDWTVDFVFDDDPAFAQLLKKIPDYETTNKVAIQKGYLDRGGSVQPVDVPPGTLGKLVSLAQTQLGKPYVFGSGPSTDSFDCSDLVQWAYKQIGIDIPRVTYDQIKAGRSVKGQALQPGDLIFPHAGHVVMYVGNGKVIAAPRTGTLVQIQNAPSNPLEVRRIL